MEVKFLSDPTVNIKINCVPNSVEILLADKYLKDCATTGN